MPNLKWYNEKDLKQKENRIWGNYLEQMVSEASQTKN
jgi:hypothetical protein